jgi:CubicO group peptidase (beta-lactamase class C family)
MRGRRAQAAAPLLVAAALVAASCSDGTEDGAAAALETVATAGSPPASGPGTSEQDEPSTTPPPTAPSSAAPATQPTTTTTTTATTTTTPIVDDGFPDQPAGVPWPTGDWPTGDPPAGVDVDAIDAAVDAAFGPDDNPGRLRSLLVVHGGEIVYERYHPLDGPETIFPSWSVAKSVTSTIIGMLVDDGRLDVDAHAPVEEWQDPGDPRAAITLDDLLTMSSGLTWEERYTPDAIAGQMFASPDWAAFVADQPLEAEPGSTFEYSTGTTALLAEIAADELGGPEQLSAFIEDELMAPTGITSTQLQLDPTGQFAGGLGFDSTARDFARFGYLMLRGGTWDGDRIVSADWIRAATEPSDTLAAYGYQWWLSDDGDWFEARGLFGQVIRVAPELDLVIVATTTNGGDSATPTAVAYEQFAGGA